MRRGLFGWMSAAALIGAVVTGCSTGGGTAADYQLPDVPGKTPTHKLYKFVLNDYGATDNAVVLVNTVGGNEFDMTIDDEEDAGGGEPDELMAKADPNTDQQEVTYTSVFTNDTASSGSGNVSASNGASVAGRDSGTSHKMSEITVGTPGDYRCGFKESMLAFNGLVKAAQEDEEETGGEQPAEEKLSYDEHLGKVDGMAVGDTMKLYPPYVVDAETAKGNRIQVTKMLDGKFATKCNILVQNDDYGAPLFDDYEYLKRLARAFDTGHLYSDQGIYSDVTDNYGTEWRYSPSGGRDKDVRVNIVLCNNAAVNGRMSAIRFCDAFKRSQAFTSNEGEYIFLNMDFLFHKGVNEETGEEYFATDGLEINSQIIHNLAHQLTHLIEMNTKVVKEGKFTNFVPGETNPFEVCEIPTLSEAYADYAGMLCGVALNGATDSASYLGGADMYNFSEVSNFSSMVSWDPGKFFTKEDDLTKATESYGRDQLLMLDIAHRYGKDRIGKLVRSERTGVKNLVSVLGDDAGTIFHNFWRTVYLGGFVGGPTDDRFPGILQNAYNLVHGLELDKENPGLSSMPFYGWSVNYDTLVTGTVTSKLDPWSASLRGYMSGAGEDGTLTLKVLLPSTGEVSVVRLRGGAFAGEVEGEWLPYGDNKDR